MAVNVNATLTDALRPTMPATPHTWTTVSPKDITYLSPKPSKALSPNRGSAKRQVQSTCHSSVNNEPSSSSYSLDRQPTDMDMVRQRVDIELGVHGPWAKEEQHYRARGCKMKDQLPSDDNSVALPLDVRHQYPDDACGVCDVDHVRDSFTTAVKTKGNLAGIAIGTGLLQCESRLTSDFVAGGPGSTNTDRRFSGASRSASVHHVIGERSSSVKDCKFWGQGALRGHDVARASHLRAYRLGAAPTHPWTGPTDCQDDGALTPRSGCCLKPATAHFALRRRWSGAAVSSHLQGASS